MDLPAEKAEQSVELEGGPVVVGTLAVGRHACKGVEVELYKASVLDRLREGMKCPDHECWICLGQNQSVVEGEVRLDVRGVKCSSVRGSLRAQKLQNGFRLSVVQRHRGDCASFLSYCFHFSQYSP